MKDHQPYTWISIADKRPPKVDETPETDGFYLLLRHNPARDEVGKYRIHLWFGSPPLDTKMWARIAPFVGSTLNREMDCCSFPAARVLRRFARRLCARLRLSKRLVCEVSSGMGLYDFHSSRDSADRLPIKTGKMVCRRCGKKFIK